MARTGTRQSLRVRLVLWTGACMLAIAGSALGTTAWSLWTHGTAAAVDRAASTATLEGQRVGRLLETRLAALAALGGAWEERIGTPFQPTKGEADSALTTLLRAREDFGSVYAMWPGDNGGGIPWAESYVLRQEDHLGSSDEPSGPDDIAEDWFRLPAVEGRTAVLDPYIDEVAGRKILMTSLVLPLRQEGKPVGMIGADLYIDQMQELLDSAKVFDGAGSLVLLSQDLQVVAWSGRPQNAGLGLDSLDAELGSLVRDAADGARERLLRDTLHVAAPVPLGSLGRWWLVVRVPREVVLRPVVEVLSRGLVVSGLLVVLGLGALWWLGGILVAPLSRLSKALSAIASGGGDLTRRLEVRGEDEIAEASAAFNRFAETVRGLVLDAKAAGVQVAGGAGSLDEVGRNLESTAADSSRGLGSAAAAVEELSSTLGEVSRSGDSAKQSILMVSAAVEEMAASIQEIAGSGERMRHEMGETVRTVERASADVEILATASREITQVVEAMQASTSGTIAGIRGIHDRIESIQSAVHSNASAVEEQSITTRDIAANVSQASSQVLEVTRQVSLAADASLTISREVASLDSLGRSAAALAGSVAQSAARLRGLAREQEERLAGFEV